MIQNVIRALGGIDHYGILSLCIFGTIFVCVLLWACLQRKQHLEKMSQLPLDMDIAPDNSTNPRHSHE